MQRERLAPAAFDQKKPRSGAFAKSGLNMNICMFSLYQGEMEVDESGVGVKKNLRLSQQVLNYYPKRCIIIPI